MSEAQAAMEAQIIGPFHRCGGCKLRMVNVTATADMRCPIDLKTVVMRARNAEYNPKRFSACVSYKETLPFLGTSTTVRSLLCCKLASAEVFYV